MKRNWSPPPTAGTARSASSMSRWRGTPEQPGLMLGLDRGGACRGLALRLPDGDRRQQLDKLFRREMTAKPTILSSALDATVDGAGAAQSAGFRDQPRRAQLFRVLSATTRWRRCWRRPAAIGAPVPTTCYNAVTNLEARGIHDRHLWRLQELVAARILGGGIAQERHRQGPRLSVNWFAAIFFLLYSCARRRFRKDREGMRCGPVAQSRGCPRNCKR